MITNKKNLIFQNVIQRMVRHKIILVIQIQFKNKKIIKIKNHLYLDGLVVNLILLKMNYSMIKITIIIIICMKVYKLKKITKILKNQI